MGKMMEYFVEQIEDVGQLPDAETECRLIVVNIDRKRAIEFAFGDTNGAAIYFHAIVSISGRPQKIINESPNVMYVGLDENQINLIVESFEATALADGELHPTIKAFVDSLRSIL